MDSKFESNSKGLIELSSSIGSHKGRMNEIVFEIKKYVGELQQEWQSLASEDFIDRYGELCKMVAFVVDSISDIEMRLVDVANSLNEDEPEIINGLNSDGGV